MAIGIGEGAEIRRPMAITVIAGNLVATFLTLIVIPVLYAVLDRKEYVKVRDRRGRISRANHSRPRRQLALRTTGGLTPWSTPTSRCAAPSPRSWPSPRWR